MENQKRSLPSGPFPIFAGKVQQSKRPRMALYTHPNNIIPTQSNNDYPRQQSFTPSWKRSQIEEGRKWNQYGVTERGQGSFTQSYHKGHHGQETPPIDTAIRSRVPVPSSSMYPVVTQHSRGYVARKENQHPTQQFIAQQHSTVVTSQQHPMVGQQVTQQSKVPSKSVRQSQSSTRVVTTTAQGIHQWVTVSDQYIIYEIFGVITSPVLSGDFNSKKFLLKTINGTVKCHYWEMGSQLLTPLTRGKHHRVMGTWDRKKEILKCVSIRSSTSEEEQFLPRLLQISDRWLKQIASSTNEQ